MTVLNQTSISYSKISAGLVQAECFINTTKSKNSLTVSSFKSLTQTIILSDGVSKPTIGQNVTQKCTQVTVPNVQQYELNFLKDSTVIAQWKVDGQKRTFSVPNKVDGLQVSQGNASSATTFSSVSLLPTSAKANGTYQCQFVFGSYKSTAAAWNGNFAPPAPPTTTTKMPSTIVPTTPTKKPMTTTTKKPITTTTKMPMTTTTKMPMTTTTKKPMTTTTKKPMTTPTTSTSTTMKPTTKMMSTTTKAPPPMTTETPKQTTTTSKTEPTKPETTTTSHHHHHSTTPKHHHPTTTSKPKGAANSIQVSLLALFFALFVFLFAH